MQKFALPLVHVKCATTDKGSWIVSQKLYNYCKEANDATIKYYDKIPQSPSIHSPSALLIGCFRQTYVADDGVSTLKKYDASATTTLTTFIVYCANRGAVFYINFEHFGSLVKAWWFSRKCKTRDAFHGFLSDFEEHASVFTKAALWMSGRGKFRALAVKGTLSFARLFDEMELRREWQRAMSAIQALAFVSGGGDDIITASFPWKAYAHRPVFASQCGDDCKFVPDILADLGDSVSWSVAWKTIVRRSGGNQDLLFLFSHSDHMPDFMARLVDVNHVDIIRYQQEQESRRDDGVFEHDDVRVECVDLKPVGTRHTGLDGNFWKTVSVSRRKRARGFCDDGVCTEVNDVEYNPDDDV